MAPPTFTDLDDDLRPLAASIFEACQLSISRGLAHGAGARVPAPTDPGSLEAIASSYLRQHDRAVIERVGARAEAHLAQSPRVRGGGLQLNVATSLLEQALHRPAPLDLTEAVTRRIRPALAPTTVSPLHPAIKRPPVAKPGPGSGSPIDAAYARPGVAQALGAPTGPERDVKPGPGRYREYEGGAIFFTEKTGAHEVHGAIYEHWKAHGGHLDYLGFPLTDETTTPDDIGRFNHFTGGSIYWTPGTGAREVHGAVLQKWASLGFERGYLGYPLTDVTDTPDFRGSFTHFEGGSVYYSEHRGVFAVNAYVANGWEKEGWEQGLLGYPLSDTVEADGVLSNRFEGGSVSCPAGGGTPDPAIPFSRVRLRLRRMRCEEETNEAGNDAITLTGVGFVGGKKKLMLEPVDLGEFGDDDGDPRDKELKQVLGDFSLGFAKGWPKTFLFTVELSERDSEADTIKDFKEFAKLIIEMVEKAVTAAVSGLVKDALAKKPDPNKAGAGKAAAEGAAAGAVVGASAGAAGAIAGAVAGAVLALVVEWIADVMENDAFLPVPIKATFDTAHQRWDGKTNTKDREWFVKGNGGHYRFWTDWQFH